MCRGMVDIHSATAEIRRGKTKKKEEETRMWADAQRDGRAAEYRWRLVRKFRNSELDTDWMHPWIGLDWIGLDWIGSNV